MGGPGSGRWYHWSSKTTVDGCKQIDVNWLQRHGYLQCGRWFGLSWSRDGEPRGSIEGHAEDGLVTLVYRYQMHGGDWEDVRQPTPLEWAPCRFGGQRPWFRCPGRGCGRRAAKLYRPGKYFLCRHCHDLVYESQRENWGNRAHRRAQNIRMRLGGSANIMKCFPPKPKGMHWRTYERLRQAAEHTKRQSTMAMAEMLDKLQGPGWRTRE